MSEPEVIELVHDRLSPWGDRARVTIVELDETVDGLSSLAAETIAAHLAAQSRGLKVSDLLFDIGTQGEDSEGTEWTRSRRCEMGIFGWNIDSPLERHALNHRIITIERFATSVDPLTVLAIPDENGGLHTYVPQFKERRSPSDPAFRIRLELAPDLFDPYKYLMPLDPSSPLVPYTLLNRQPLVDVLGSEEGLHRALKTCEFGTPEQACQIRELMIEAWERLFGR